MFFWIYIACSVTESKSLQPSWMVCWSNFFSYFIKFLIHVVCWFCMWIVGSKWFSANYWFVHFWSCNKLAQHHWEIQRKNKNDKFILPWWNDFQSAHIYLKYCIYILMRSMNWDLIYHYRLLDSVINNLIPLGQELITYKKEVIGWERISLKRHYLLIYKFKKEWKMDL